MKADEMTSSPFLSEIEPTCPEDLLARALQFAPPRIAIARAGAPAPMEAAKEGAEAGVMVPVFVGERDRIEAEAKALSWDISSYDLIEADGEDGSAMAASGAVREGQADVLMKGHLHTDSFMKAAINRNHGLRTDKRFVHIFHMSPPAGGKPLLISDAAVNVAPNMTTRQDAIRLVVDLSKRLGTTRPRVAILSATESAIESVPSSIEGRDLAAWAIEHVPDADVRGPLAMDLILSGEAAATKGMADDPVAGQADAIIVPDIVSGNALFKTLVYVGGACAAGVVMGGSAPILLTSRADPPAARLASAALSQILCAKPKAG
jgi:phosphate acetyltransferase